MRKTRIFVTVLFLCLMGALVLWTGALLDKYVLKKYGWWISFIPGLILTLRLLYFWIRNVPADPPHKGVLVFLGKRRKVLLDEGWHFLPLYPLVFRVVMVEVRKINFDLPEQLVRTPDNAELAVKPNLTFTPGAPEAEGREQACFLINYLNSGEKTGVMNIIQAITMDRLRGWALSPEEGPADWKEAMGAKDEAIAVLIKAILGEEIDPIPSPVPTAVLLKYFSSPRRSPSKYEKKKWGRKTKGGNEWEKLEEELAKLSPEERRVLEEAVGERRKTVKEVQEGNGAFQKKSLGITINRFTISHIEVRGKVAKAAEQAAKELHEMAAEKIEIAHVLARAKSIQEGLGVSPEQALEVVQSERGKVPKEVIDVRGGGIVVVTREKGKKEKEEKEEEEKE